MPNIERTKEIREWTTLIVSILTLLVIPVIGYGTALFIKNQKLEIEMHANELYVTKVLYTSEKARADAELANTRSDSKQEVKDIGVKVDKIIVSQEGMKVSQEGMAHDVSALKETINNEIRKK